VAARLGSLSPLISANVISVGNLGIHRLATVTAANVAKVKGGVMGVANPVKSVGNLSLAIASLGSVTPLGTPTNAAHYSNTAKLAGGTTSSPANRLIGSLGLLLSTANSEIKPLGSMVSSAGVNQGKLEGDDAGVFPRTGSILASTCGLAIRGTATAFGKYGFLGNTAGLSQAVLHGDDLGLLPLSGVWFQGSQGVGTVPYGNLACFFIGDTLNQAVLRGDDTGIIRLADDSQFLQGNLGVCSRVNGVRLSSLGVSYNQAAGKNPAGLLQLTGFAPTFESGEGKRYNVTSGVIALSGNTPHYTAPSYVLAESGVINLTSNNPVYQVLQRVDYQPSTGVLTLANVLPSVTIGQGKFVSPPTGVLSLSATNPTITARAGKFYQPTTGTLSLTGHSATFFNNASKRINAISGVLSLQGNAPHYATPRVFSFDFVLSSCVVDTHDWVLSWRGVETVAVDWVLPSAVVSVTAVDWVLTNKVQGQTIISVDWVLLSNVDADYQSLVIDAHSPETPIYGSY